MFIIEIYTPFKKTEVNKSTFEVKILKNNYLVDKSSAPNHKTTFKNNLKKRKVLLHSI